MAKECGERHISEQCLCNSGIASGNAFMQDKEKMYKTFYSGALKGGFGTFNYEDDEDEDDEDEDEEAEFERQNFAVEDGGSSARFNNEIEDL